GTLTVSSAALAIGGPGFVATVTGARFVAVALTATVAVCAIFLVVVVLFLLLFLVVVAVRLEEAVEEAAVVARLSRTGARAAGGGVVLPRGRGSRRRGAWRGGNARGRVPRRRAGAGGINRGHGDNGCGDHPTRSRARVVDHRARGNGHGTRPDLT